MYKSTKCLAKEHSECVTHAGMHDDKYEACSCTCHLTKRGEYLTPYGKRFSVRKWIASFF